MKNGRYEENGTVSWYLEDKLDREDGPAVESRDGDKQWYLNGTRHREGGPAIELANGTKQWWVNGKLHREDGPAAEWADGTEQWFLNDIEYTEQEFQQWLDKKKLNEKLQATLQPKPTQKRSKI